MADNTDDKTGTIWMDGTQVPWDKATVHVLTHTLHYGVGAFEGIRCYRHENDKSAVFRLTPFNTPPCPVKDERDFAHVVREAFGQRRKTLRAIFKNAINSEQLEAIGINPLARAETLSLADFAHLSDCYSDLNRD